MIWFWLVEPQLIFNLANLLFQVMKYHSFFFLCFYSCHFLSSVLMPVSVSVSRNLSCIKIFALRVKCFSVNIIKLPCGISIMLKAGRRDATRARRQRTVRERKRTTKKWHLYWKWLLWSRSLKNKHRAMKGKSCGC